MLRETVSKWSWIQMLEDQNAIDRLWALNKGNGQDYNW